MCLYIIAIEQEFVNITSVLVFQEAYILFLTKFFSTYAANKQTIYIYIYYTTANKCMSRDANIYIHIHIS